MKGALARSGFSIEGIFDAKGFFLRMSRMAEANSDIDMGRDSRGSGSMTQPDSGREWNAEDGENR